jgi:hypothetical protein
MAAIFSPLETGGGIAYKNRLGLLTKDKNILN